MYPPLAIFILVIITSICKGLYNGSCDVFPRDLYIEVGSSVEIVCQTSCVRGKIFWTLDNRRIDESLSKTINSSHAVLTLRNVTNSIATLQCLFANTQQAVGGTTIRTYKKPSKLSCILHYENQATGSFQMLFTCNWEHLIYPSLTINYTVLCDPPSCPLPKELCSSHKGTCTSHYSNIQGEIPVGGHYNLTVRAKSAAWEASSNLYEFIPLKTLKILQPELGITATSDHLLVAWSIPLHMPQYQYKCQVKYRKAASEGPPEWVLNKTLCSSLDKREMTIGKLESCSNYTFAVRCALNEAPWSTWSQEHMVLTKLNKSDFKPHLWRKVAEADKNGVRNVRAMWMEIPSTCQDTFTYRISQTSYKERGSSMDTLCENAICDMNRDAHRIKMTVFHNETMFVEHSVYVPAIGESLSQVTNIQTSTFGGVILVSWMAPVQPVSSYMIDYTHNGDQYSWKETKHTNVTLFDLLDKKPYDITVTPLFDDKTGYGSQVLQICSSVGDPGTVAIANVRAEDKHAHVSWTVKSQQPCSGAIVNFTVFYSSQNQPQLNFTVDAMQQEILLKDLKPETQYSVYVQATALTGATKSSERFFKTIRFDPKLSSALSVGSGILILLVLSLGMCCVIQWKKFKENPVPNPGHSSLAMWPSSSHEKGTCPFLPIHDLFENIYDSVYTEEAQRASTLPLNTSYNDNSSSDQTEESAPAPNEQNGLPFEALETECPSSSGETIGLLCSPEKCLPSPYKSQRPVKTPAQRVSKQCKRVSVKQQEKTTSPTIYVTLDMFLTKAAQVEKKPDDF